MKMVSGLTRQAMSRHRLLSAQTFDMKAEPPPAPIPAPAPTQPRQSAHAAAPAPPRPRTIYQQLMSSHDRLTERHLHRT